MKNMQDDSIKKELDKGNNFVDYFVIIGLKQEILFDDFLYENDLSILNASKLINPEILTKFPPFDKTTINIDENMIRHIFPSGYKIKESATTPNPEGFCLILDNNFFSINYPQKFISCLIFYENLTTYKKIYEKYKSFNEEEFRMEENKIKYDRFKSSNVNIADSTNLSIANYNSNNSINENNEENSFSVNNIPGSYSTEGNGVYGNLRSSSSCSNLGKPFSSVGDNLRISKNYFSTINNKKLKYKNYYAPKCICLVSVYPFFVEFSKILRNIYKFTKSPKLKKPLEKIIENLVIEVPVPPRGFYSVEYHLFNEKYILTQTPMNQLPFLSIEFEKIFINFKIEQILEIYKHVLLETRILFFSDDLSNLTPIIQGFISLIYPFKYPFQYVTILPEENFNFLESVSPYIIGINQRYKWDFFAKNEVDIEDLTILMVDIDNRKIELTSPNLSRISQLSLRKKFMVEEFPDLPKHYKNKLTSKITDYIQKIKSKMKDKDKEDTESFSLTIRSFFFQFIVNILQNYNKYLNNDYYTQNEIASPSISSLFKIEEFINSTEYSDKPFYRKLVKETQLFVEFILKRMIPKDGKDKLEILFFDENLMQKGSRRLFGPKANTPFINSNLYEIKHTYSVHKNRGFLEEEIKDFRDKIELRREALKYGQEIFFENNEIFISYPIFPCLMTEIFFKNNIKNYYLPPNLSDDLEPINIDIVSKSHLGSVSLHYSEMENYIYLCWIQLWTITFWYHDEEEKRFRFQQLLQVLDMVINHEMEIFNLLFETLSIYAEDFMIMKLYERLVYYKLNPSYSICNTVMKLIDKKQLLNKVGVGSVTKYVEKYDFKKTYDSHKFRKRSIKNKYDLNILSDDVKFYTWDTCIDCQTNINLEHISRDFQNMKRDILWATCPNCGTGLLPKIAVRFGKELNNLDFLKFNTSSYEGFVLYSPFHLKYNYNNGLLKEFGMKLDLDSFKLRFSAIFWGSIWYFKLKNLQFDFMLPYEYRVEMKNMETQIQKSFVINYTGKIIRKKTEDSFIIININNKSNEIDRLKLENEASNLINDFNYISNQIIVQERTNELSFWSGKRESSESKNNNEIKFEHIEEKIEIISENNQTNNNQSDIIEINTERKINDNHDILDYNEHPLITENNALPTEQSYVNHVMLVDNSTFYDLSSRFMDTDQSSIFSDLESVRGNKRSQNIKLNIIKEVIDENIVDGTPKMKMSSSHLINSANLSQENINKNEISDIMDLENQGEESIFKRTGISEEDKNDDIDRTPIKDDFQNDKEVVFMFKKKFDKNAESIDSCVKDSLQKVIDDIQIKEDSNK